MGFFRSFFIMIDKVVFNLIDTAYNLIFSIAGAALNSDVVKAVMKNLYIIVGIFAFLRIAIILVNSLIDPEKLSEKGKGLGNILVRTVIMLVLLLFTPMLFDMAYDLQSDIIGKAGDPGSGHIIEKLILGQSAIGDTSGDATPADQFKSTALTALIPVDEKFVEGKLQVPSEENGWMGGYVSKCSTNECVYAIKRWNEMYVSRKMDINVLSNYISTYEKVDVGSNDENPQKEKVYVYNYNIILTTIVGGFIVYILFSFALDIAMRVFQLAALEIIAPVFITTFVDPKSTSSGMFSRWLKEVGSTYANLFIRIAIVSLLLLFTSIINTIEFVELGDNSNWVKLTLLLGLLIFAKKAPKWISDLLGIKSDGMGLWTPKKLKENMLGGALMAGAAKGLAGATAASAMNLGHLARNRIARNKKLKEADEQAYKDSRRVGNAEKNKKYYKDRYLAHKMEGMDHKAAVIAAAEDGKKALAMRKAKKEQEKLGFGASAARVGKALLNGTLSFKAAANSDKLSGSLKLAKDNSKHFKKISGLEGKSVGEKVSKWISDKNEAINNFAFGDANAIANRADLLKKENFIKDNYNKAALNNVKAEIPDFDYTKLVNGKGRGLQYSYTDEGDYITNFDHYLRSLVANASGYKVHYEKSADGKIITDDNGIPKIYYTGKDGSRLSDDMALKIRENAKHITSNEGTAKLQEIFNMKSANLLDDYGRNLSNISDTTQVINNIRDSISKVADSFTSKIKGLSSDISGVISGSIGNLKIDFNSLGLSEDLKNKFKAIQGDGPLTSANLSMIISEIERDPALASSGLAEKFENLKTIALDNDEYNNYNRLLSSKNEELSEYLRRQDLMDPAYNAVGYKMADEGRILFEGEGLEKQLADVRNISHAERERKQQSQQGRIEDQVKLFEKKKEEDGK